MTPVLVVCALVRSSILVSGGYWVGRDAGRIVCERMWYATGYSGVDCFPVVILGESTCGAVGVYTLGGWAEVCTGNSGGAVAGGLWAVTLGASGGFTLGSG